MGVGVVNWWLEGEVIITGWYNLEDWPGGRVTKANYISMVRFPLRFHTFKERNLAPCTHYGVSKSV